MNKFDINWFKEEIAPTLVHYKIDYRFFLEGDFGSLNQVVIDSSDIGCEIDFWSSGRLSIFIWDYKNEKQLLNELLELNEELEKQKALEKMLKILL